MAGVRPKILCPQCNNEVKWNAEKCPSCGTEIDWAGISSRSPEKAGRRADRRGEDAPRAMASRAVIGVIILATAVVIVYEAVNGRRSISGSPGSSSMGDVQANDAQATAQIQALENSVAAHPEDLALTLQLANFLQDHSMFQKAIQYYSVYLAKNPKNADARVDMGICYKGIDDLNEAERQMKEALRYEPKHVNATFNLGIVCLDEGKVQESNEWFKKAVALDPNGEVGKKAGQLLAQHNSQIPPTQ